MSLSIKSSARLAQSLRGRPGPPAVAFWRHQPVLDQEAMTLARATLAFHEAVGGDLAKLTPAGTYQATAMGLVDEWRGDFLGRRAIAKRPVTEPGDWCRRGPEGPGRMEAVNLEAAAWLRRNLPECIALVATVFSPLTQAFQLAGGEALARHIQEDPEALRAGLAILGRRTLDLVAGFREAGVDGIYYAAQHHVKDLIPSRDILDLGWEQDRLVLDACRAFPARILHFHGQPLKEDLPGLPEGWTAHFEWEPGNPAPAEVGRHTGCPMAVGLPITVLAGTTSPSECRRVAGEALETFDQASALVTAGCVLPMDFPLEQARAWVEALGAWTP